MSDLWCVVYPLTLYLLLGLARSRLRRLRLPILFDHAFLIGSLISIRLVTEVTNNGASCGACSQHSLQSRFGYGLHRCLWSCKSLSFDRHEKAWVTGSRSESTAPLDQKEGIPLSSSPLSYSIHLWWKGSFFVGVWALEWWSSSAANKSLASIDKPIPIRARATPWWASALLDTFLESSKCCFQEKCIESRRDNAF